MFWKTVVLGQHGDFSSYNAALRAKGFRVGIEAHQILRQIEIAESETEVDLTIRTVEELGFDRGGHRFDIYSTAVDTGLSLCAPEIGPALRLIYKSQPRGELLRIAMNPIENDNSNYPSIFILCNYFDGYWLSTENSRYNSFWRPGIKWVFTVPCA